MSRAVRSSLRKQASRTELGRLVPESAEELSRTMTDTQLSIAMFGAQRTRRALVKLLQRVEVRQSNPSQQNFALVILDARKGTELPVGSFRAAGRIRADMPIDVNPDVPPEGIITFTDARSSQKLHYEFTTNSQKLTNVIVERRPGR